MIPALRILHKRQVGQAPEDQITTTEPLLIEQPETGVTLGQILGLYNIPFLSTYEHILFRISIIDSVIFLHHWN